MCLITEHAKAKQRIGELEEQVVKLEAEAGSLQTTIKSVEEQLIPPEGPTVKEVISRTIIESLYEEIFPSAGSKVFIADIEYEITAISELRRFIEWDNTNIFRYVAELHDCDDFALALAGDFAKYPEWSGFPASFIWGNLYGGHAFFTCVAWKSLEDKTPTVFFVEPQNDHEIAEEMVADMELWLLPM